MLLCISNKQFYVINCFLFNYIDQFLENNNQWASFSIHFVLSWLNGWFNFSFYTLSNFYRPQAYTSNWTNISWLMWLWLIWNTNFSLLLNFNICLLGRCGTLGLQLLPPYKWRNVLVFSRSEHTSSSPHLVLSITNLRTRRSLLNVEL